MIRHAEAAEPRTRTMEYRLPIGTQMTVWKITYTWRPAESGCGASHYLGATPDVPAHAEVESAELMHLGQAYVSAATTYEPNKQRFYTSMDADEKWGELMWDLVAEGLQEEVIASERLQWYIAKFEADETNH